MARKSESESAGSTLRHALAVNESARHEFSPFYGQQLINQVSSLLSPQQSSLVEVVEVAAAAQTINLAREHRVRDAIWPRILAFAPSSSVASGAEGEAGENYFMCAGSGVRRGMRCGKKLSRAIYIIHSSCLRCSDAKREQRQQLLFMCAAGSAPRAL
jgi:hypothetical protein